MVAYDILLKSGVLKTFVVVISYISNKERHFWTQLIGMYTYLAFLQTLYV